jgi:hypothetical protein
MAPASVFEIGLGVDARADIAQRGAPRADRTVNPAGKLRTHFQRSRGAAPMWSNSMLRALRRA